MFVSICLFILLTASASVGQETATQSVEPASQVEQRKEKIDEWTQWRGPNRDGKVIELGWPDSLAEDKLVEEFSVPLGPSYSGPIVAEGKVFVTETEDRKFEVVKAFSVETGEELWRASWEGSHRVPFFAASNGSWIRSTPAFSEGKLYVLGIRDVLVCLDAENGKVIWKLDFPEKMKTPVPSFGAVCSPMIDGDDLYVQAAGAFVKLNKNDGEVIWETLINRDAMNGSAFSSPYIAELGGLRQLVVQTRTELHGVSIEDGRDLWSQEIPAYRGMNIVTPTVFGNGVFTSTYGGNSQMVNVEYREGLFSTETAWSAPVQGYMNSPVIIDGHAYLHLKNQRFACFDLAAGELKWKSGERFGKYASMIGSGNKLLVLTAKGDLMLMKANPKELEIISTRKVSDNSWAHIAVTEDQVFVRELKCRCFS